MVGFIIHDHSACCLSPGAIRRYVPVTLALSLANVVTRSAKTSEVRFSLHLLVLRRLTGLSQMDSRSLAHAINIPRSCASRR
jgi:hypothetical protein